MRRRPEPEDTSRVVERLGAVLPGGDASGWVPGPADAGAELDDEPEVEPEVVPEVEPEVVPEVEPDDEPEVAAAGAEPPEESSDEPEASWSPHGAPVDDDAPGLLGAVRRRLPPTLRRGRVAPARAAAAALLVVALAAAAVVGLLTLRSRPTEVAAPAVVSSGIPLPGGRATPMPTPSGDVVVSVAGAVVHPGLVRLPPGSRIDDAVRAAGGLAPGASYGLLNLARRLVDGEQVLVGVAAAAAAAAPGGAAPPGAPVDLNAATVEQLDGLPGVGPVLAQHIVDWRTEHGRFASVDQLREVSGIGESKYAALKNKVAV